MVSYTVIEEYIDSIVDCADDYIVTFVDPDGRFHTHYFNKEPDESIFCAEDYIEGQEYIDLVGICRVCNVLVCGNELDVAFCDTDTPILIEK